MTFYPIFIPISEGSDAVYYFPTWVTVMVCISLAATIMGLMALVLSVMLDVAFDQDTERLFKFGTAMLLGGIFLFLFSVPMMLITGIRME